MTWEYPVPSGTLSQGFGPSWLGVEGPAFANFTKAHDADNGPNGNGQGPFNGGTYYQHFHAALDMSAPYGAPILAPQSGIVLDAEFGYPGSWADGGGYFVRVLVNPVCMYLVAHCSSLDVYEGDRVSKGDLIARVGSTGVATGNHAHFWIRLGPTPYYDPDAFYYDPRLLLFGGALYGDIRFEPGFTGGIPDTSLPPPDRIVATGDPTPMKYISLIDNGKVKQHHLRAFKPIRTGASINDKVIDRADANGRTINCVGRFPKEKLPASEQKYGDVFIADVFDSGSRLGYVKAVDIKF